MSQMMSSMNADQKKHRWHAAVAAVIMKYADNLAAHLLLNGTGQMAPDKWHRTNGTGQSGRALTVTFDV